MRIMAVDLGDARTGLAVSDLLGMLCGEAWTVKEWNMERMADLICEEAEKRDVERIILGQKLLSARTDLPIVLWDERRSSVEAHQILHMNGKREKNHRATVDAVAASLILEGYLGSNPG